MRARVRLILGVIPNITSAAKWSDSKKIRKLENENLKFIKPALWTNGDSAWSKPQVKLSNEMNAKKRLVCLGSSDVLKFFTTSEEFSIFVFLNVGDLLALSMVCGRLKALVFHTISFDLVVSSNRHCLLLHLHPAANTEGIIFYL